MIRIVNVSINFSDFHVAVFQLLEHFVFFSGISKINERHWTEEERESASCTLPLIGTLHSVMRQTNALFVGRVQRVQGDMSECATRSSCRHPSFIPFPFFFRSFSHSFSPLFTPSRYARRMLPTKISNRSFSSRNFWEQVFYIKKIKKKVHRTG